MKTKPCKGCEGRDKIIESLERRVIAQDEKIALFEKSLVDGIIEPDPAAAALYRDGDIEKFFGCAPDFTGDLSTVEYLAELREK